MRTYLWLDDIRDPFMYLWQIQYTPDYIKGVDHIVWVKTYEDFVEWIQTNGLPDEVFFDHDLGPTPMKDGYDAAKWLGNYCIDNNLDIPKFDIQSANPVGARNIREYLNNCKKFINDEK